MPLIPEIEAMRSGSTKSDAARDAGLTAPEKTFGHVFPVYQRCEYAARCNDEEADFLKVSII